LTQRQGLNRPIGWWLKEADARLEAAFTAALDEVGADRRTWQVMTTVSRKPTARAEVVSALQPFDPPAAVDQVIDTLIADKLVEEGGDGLLRLTAAGEQRHATLAPLVDKVRGRVREVLSDDEYATLVDLLARLVHGLPEPSGRPT